MSIRRPFQITESIVQEAGLDAGDVGFWCVLVDDCYHLFSREDQANLAYNKLLSGVFVR